MSAGAGESGSGGVVTVTTHVDGPLQVMGPIRIVTESGRVVEVDEGENWLCRCGGSKNKPFCDGTHSKIGFRAAEEAVAEAEASGGVTADGFVDAAALSTLPEGEVLGVQVAGRPVALCNVDGQICAVGAICSHQNASLVNGELDGHTLWCPLHSSGFDVRTGEANQPPATAPIPTYEVKIEGGRVLVSVEPRSG